MKHDATNGSDDSSQADQKSSGTGQATTRRDPSRPQEMSTRRQMVDRRAVLIGGASLVGLTAARLLVPQASGGTTHSRNVRDDPTRIPGAMARSYGERSPFETTSRLTAAQRSLTPHQNLHGIVTPSALHFERHHNGVPDIDPSRHRLLVHGLVDQPMIFTLDDLTRLPSTSRLAFIECSGNSGKEWTGPKGHTVQETHGLLSTSEWTGVRLKIVLDHAGVRPEGTWMLAEGSDAAALTRSIPLAEVIDEALLCYGQNGEALRPEQGYPLRLLLPGWEGSTNIKWLRRLEVGTAPFMTREETSKYTDLMPDGTARQFTFVMEAKSVITAPSGGQHIHPGFVEIRGLAWSGRGRVARVEVSTDGGHDWQTAHLQEPVLPRCVTRFRFPWRWNGQTALLQSRCTDETGYVQPSRQALVDVRGTRSYYHYNGIQRWRVSRNGEVTNV